MTKAKDIARAKAGTIIRNIKVKTARPGFICAHCHIHGGLLFRPIGQKYYYHEKCERVMVPF